MSTTPDRQSPLELPCLLGAELQGSASDVVEAIDRCAYTLMAMVRLTSPRENSRAVNTITTQAINDFIDMAGDLITCRGRSALRAARAMFEHLVNLLDVVASTADEQRYLAQEAVAAIAEAEGEFGHDQLRGKELLAARHAARKLLRDAKSDYDDAINQYGLNFRRQWATSNLKDRAAAHGLNDEYSFYRLASMVLHGSAGGIKSLMQSEPRYRNPVYRTGPALDLLPLAYLYGLRYFIAICDEIAARHTNDSTKQVKDALSRALDLWPEYRRKVARIDATMWPEAVMDVVAIVGIDHDDQQHWFLHDPERSVIIDAASPSPTELSPDQQVGLAQVASTLPPPERRDPLITVAMEGVNVTPLPDAEWRPEADVLVAHSSGRFFDEPRKVPPLSETMQRVQNIIGLTIEEDATN